MTTEIQKQIDLILLDRANIKDTNNIKDTKDTKDLKTLNDYTQSSGNLKPIDFVSLEQASPKEQTAFSKERASVSAPPWSHLKIDLFDNSTRLETNKGQRSFKLKLSFVYPDRPNQSLSAGLNCDWRMLKRGFDFSDPDDLAHYSLLEEIYIEANDNFNDVRASKCYDNVRGIKGRSVIGISVVVGQLPADGQYFVILVDGTDIFDIKLSNKNITLKQQKGNCIASGSMGTDITLPKLKAKDFHSR
jgi:hypothetical protein